MLHKEYQLWSTMIHPEDTNLKYLTSLLYQQIQPGNPLVKTFLNLYWASVALSSHPQGFWFPFCGSEVGLNNLHF